MVFIMSMGYLLWALIAYRFLPDHDVAERDISETEKVAHKAVVSMSKGKENCTYVAFLVAIIGMMFAKVIGEAAYVIPVMATSFLCLVGVFDFKEVRNQLFSPLVLMMAGVIGVANALAASGFTALVGEWVANAMGSNASVFVLTLMFCLLASSCATLTGSNIGSLFIFAPIGIATCMSLGINPTGLAAAVTMSVFGGGFLPIDGQPAMALGMGKYKLSQFFKFTIPMYLVQIVALVIGSMIAFPV